jgi:glucosamine 6-phosphate synthetase-like amidotransferase/phosphosugar isomerase protein
MCCLFGFVDYAGSLSVKQKNHLIRELSIAAEVRGTDATGIAYNTSRGLQIYKRPLAAYRLHLRIPAEAHVVMGHTRMTTQGSAKKNYNNHPFFGCVKGKRFALAHNGVLWNDRGLRHTKHLPKTKIQTDSYVAVQLLEQQKALDFDSLAKMAEQVEGSFSFAVLDEQDALWIVKGDSPLSIAYFPECGVYVYASTVEILNKALTRCGKQLGHRRTVEVEMGDLLKIDRRGHITRATFDASKLCRPSWEYWSSSLYAEPPKTESEHIRLLKSVARAFGFTGEMIDRLLDQGFTTDDIEEILYEGTW